MSQTVLVVGGTGMLGEPVVRELAAAGHRVRVLTRYPERAERLRTVCELVRGDVDDRASVERALAGCGWAHLSLNGNGDFALERRGAELVSSLAAAAGVKRLSLISGASTDEANAWFPMTRAKLDAERAVKASGVPAQIFRCTMFMEVLPKMVRGTKAMILGAQPGRLHWLAAKDYASMVARAFALPAAANVTFHLRGPEAMTMEEALSLYCRHCAPEAKVVHLPFWVARLVGLVSGNRELRTVAVPLMAYFEKTGELGDPAQANALLGAPRTTVEMWARAAEQRLSPRPLSALAGSPARAD
jgi:uncharacterized protein YbjT (DUF2867 family)